MDLRRARVMLVDDDPICRALMADDIEALSGRVVQFGSAAEVMRHLQDQPAVDVFLLDVHLDDHDGLDLLRAIKALPAHRHTPVVLVTGDQRSQSVEAGVRAGAYFYLTKPAGRTLLGAVLGAALDHARERHRQVEAISRHHQVASLLQAGRFALRDLDQAAAVAQDLAAICPAPEAAALALHELLINAVEHGNLGIDYATKTRLMLEGDWRGEVARRLGDPVLGQRQVHVDYRRQGGAVEITIEDEGDGFDWQHYIELSPERMFHPHGRGIAMAAASGPGSLHYEGRGNRVRLRWAWPDAVA